MSCMDRLRPVRYSNRHGKASSKTKEICEEDDEEVDEEEDATRSRDDLEAIR